MGHGALYVMTDGTIEMLQWCVDNSVTMDVSYAHNKYKTTHWCVNSLPLSIQHPIHWSDTRANIFCQILISIWMMLIALEMRTS